jgi:hypothetical protein
MIYSSPICPDDGEVFTKNGKMKISKLYYKMNPKRDPYNRILDVQHLFLSKCISNKKENNDSKSKEMKLKEIKNLNEYYNSINRNMNNKYIDQMLLNQENIPYYLNDYTSTIFPTSINVNNTCYKKRNIANSESKNNSKINCSNGNSKISSNRCNNSSIYINQSISTFNKPKKVLRSHSYIMQLDKTYYKNSTLNKKVYLLNHQRRNINNVPGLCLSNTSSVYFNDSDMTKYNDYIPFAKQSYLNGQFEFDYTKSLALGQLKQYQMKETQNRKKVKPFLH